MSELSARMQAFLDKQEIYEVLTRYCRGVDRGDVEMIKSVYHEDAIDDHGIFKGRGKDFAEWIVDFLKDIRQCQHLIGNVQIELDGDVAWSETYCLSISDDGERHQTVFNRYIDRFERRNGEWLIAHRLIAFDISRSDPVTESYGAELGDALTMGKRDKTDQVYRRW